VRPDGPCMRQWVLGRVNGAHDDRTLSAAVPRVFETVLTSRDGTVQYQLRTHVRTAAIL